VRPGCSLWVVGRWLDMVMHTPASFQGKMDSRHQTNPPQRGVCGDCGSHCHCEYARTLRVIGGVTKL